MTKTTEQHRMKNLPQQSSTSNSNSNSTHSSSCCSSSSSPLSSSPNIQFQQQCLKDPSYFQNLTMKSQQPKRKRNPLSDCTNTTSSSAKSTKFKPSYFSHVFKNLSTNYASNPTSSPSPSTPPLPNKLPTPEIVDLEASGNISIAYGRRYSSNKSNDREKEVDIPTSSVPNSEPIKFHQQCQKDPNSFQNLTMEYERKRKLTRRTPFSDCTNTSSSVPPKSTKSKPSSSSPVFKNLSTNAIAVNLDDAANPSSSPSTFLSTPLPKKSSTPEIVDLEAPETISVVYSRRYSSNKRKDKEKEVVIPTSSSVPIKMKDKENEVVNLANSAPIKRKDKGKDTVISESSNFMDTWEKAIISESSASIKRKDKGKECDIPSSTTSISKVSNTRVKFDGLERAIPSKAKAFSAPCTKGCDGSILLDDTSSFTGEKTAIPNNNSARGFEVIDKIKAAVEEVCPGVVSCADILAVTARDSVEILGGPTWDVKLGRRDARTASKSAANKDIPAPSSTLNQLIKRYNALGLSTKDLVALSGGHTIGQARCTNFRAHIYNDTDIDTSFARTRQSGCPKTSGSGDNNLAPLDLATPTSFDNHYFKNLVDSKGLLHSDQVLFNGGSADSIVHEYSTNPSSFFSDFVTAMIKMGDISPLTGSNGEIRKNCRRAN